MLSAIIFIKEMLWSVSALFRIFSVKVMPANSKGMAISMNSSKRDSSLVEKCLNKLQSLIVFTYIIRLTVVISKNIFDILEIKRIVALLFTVPFLLDCCWL